MIKASMNHRKKVAILLYTFIVLACCGWIAPPG